MTKDEILDFAETVPGYYDRPELSRLYDFVHALPEDSKIVEIGVLYGRSSSVYFLESLTRMYPLQITLIDPWVVEGTDAKVYFDKMVSAWSIPFTTISLRSEEAAQHITGGIDLLHIDGYHEGVHIDCELYLPKLKINGIVIFHDYHRPSEYPKLGSVFPTIDAAVDKYTSGPNWEDLGTVVTQAARRKLA